MFGNREEVDDDVQGLGEDGQFEAATPLMLETAGIESTPMGNDDLGGAGPSTLGNIAIEHSNRI